MDIALDRVSVVLDIVVVVYSLAPLDVFSFAYVWTNRVEGGIVYCRLE